MPESDAIDEESSGAEVVVGAVTDEVLDSGDAFSSLTTGASVVVELGAVVVIVSGAAEASLDIDSAGGACELVAASTGACGEDEVC